MKELGDTFSVCCCCDDCCAFCHVCAETADKVIVEMGVNHIADRLGWPSPLDGGNNSARASVIEKGFDGHDVTVHDHQQAVMRSSEGV